MKSMFKPLAGGLEEEKHPDQHNTRLNSLVNNISSDSLLAKVLDGIEHEEENLYAKPRGKNYRQFSLRSARTSDQNQPNKLDSTQSLQDDIPLWSSDTSVSSESEEDDIISVNTELIEFIDAKKDFILNLI